ncbi:MAG: endopeptidase La [Flavobacteriales bacterium]|nr:endopeptidase La [Flavobacteriales bacterium]
MKKKLTEEIIIELGLSDQGEGDTDFIPLITTEDEEQFDQEETPKTLPILPLRNTVLFPGVVIPITVGRDKSIKLIQEAKKANSLIGVLSQQDAELEDPEAKDLYSLGTVAQILRLLKMPDGTTTAIIQGKKRFSLIEMIQDDPYFKAAVKEHPEVRYNKDNPNMKAAIDSLKEVALEIIEIAPNIPSEAAFAIKNIESYTFLVNFISSNMNIDLAQKQEILEESDLLKRAQIVLAQLIKEKEMLQLKQDIQSKVKLDIDRQQREYFLHQQMKTIQEELGDNPHEEELREMKERAKAKKWNEETAKAFDKEMHKLERMNPAGAEYSVQLNYCELLLDLPWNEYSKDRFDLKRAQKILNRDHYGLEKVKERIIEYLAVLKLKNDMKAPILCLYGPPGVGKTSLGKSIAEAIGRKYVRMSLGGLRDEAEIRGHRRTYIGAMPGRIIQNLRKVGTSNPLFVLDEIDKVGKDSHGDPQSALLEVLDPEQNERFNDNYVELDYDLSKVLFVATCNNLSSIHPALRDRMEIIEVNGYTVEEKVQIAKRHLVPKQLDETGVPADAVSIDKKVLEHVIENYTRESGVRGLEKRISKLVRNRAKQIAMNQKYEAAYTVSELHDVLGVAHEKDKYEGNDVAGVVTGLAWTPVGGDVLFIETSLTKGKGKLTMTGNLGDVMKESATLAMQYLKAHSHDLGLDQTVFDKWDVHIHVPAGAVPKDGPSAGITMLTALASAFTQKKVKKFLAMTGEITLRGKVLPVGGIKEKILAAKRADIKEIILSSKNKKDIMDIEPKYVKGLKFHYVDEMMEVIELALLDQKVKKPLRVA